MNYAQMTIFGFLIIFSATIIGSLASFLVGKKQIEKANSLSVGFSSGVMLAASFWSLLLPSVNLSQTFPIKVLPPVAGLILGGLFMTGISRIGVFKVEKDKKIKPLKLFVAVTVHNIPEGLAVGFSFGTAKLSGSYDAYMTALTFAVGIAIQNLPEGAAVSLPFLSATKNKAIAFFLGGLSGVVEPLFAALGFYLSESLSFLQPYLLAFAGGAMIFVVFDDLLPSEKGNGKFFAWTTFFGFVVMTALDVLLG